MTNYTDDELIDAYLAGTIDETGFQELELRLRAKRSMREKWCLLTRMDLSLSTIAAEKVRSPIIRQQSSNRSVRVLLISLLVCIITAVIIILLSRHQSDSHLPDHAPLPLHKPSASDLLPLPSSASTIPTPTSYQSFALNNWQQLMDDPDYTARGWAKSWGFHFDKPADYTINPNSFVGHAVQINGETQLASDLKHPIDFAANQTTFVAVAYKPQISDKNFQFLVTLWDENNNRYAIHHYSEHGIFIDVHKDRVASGSKIVSDDVLCLIIKITASHTASDQIVVGIFPLNNLPIHEPSTWHAYGPRFNHVVKVNRIHIRAPMVISPVFVKGIVIDSDYEKATLYMQHMINANKPMKEP